MGKSTAKQIHKISGLISELKNPSILLGVLYGICFLIMLPIQLSKTSSVGNLFLAILYSIIPILIVHFLLNFLYYLVISIPLIMSIVIASIGLFIWLFAPLQGVILDTILNVINLALLTLGDDIFNVSGSLNYYIEFVSRLGQTLITIGGGLWWLVKKAKDINYVALYAYIIFLSFLLILSGIIQPSYTIIFLILWATLAIKVKENDSLPDLKLLFKIVANISIFVAIFRTQLITVSNLSSISNLLSINRKTFFNSNGYNYFVFIYSSIIFLLTTFGIWKPNIILTKMPSKMKKIVEYIKGLAVKYFFFKI
ncbi:hypothetical protein [Proteiniborus sp. MB09-C3]|uniref:hypothetical protein n=1 Tax=Proteiniborus sp. MB09-C3 TaxID=3050072 RepID=UPI0025526AD5|nr:hypothetical protein [Proteiniborus sp. MB09-C3]WIV11082.1 hypothetical protein QO263_13095 [Proteiniborus sp. MB09-C3]